MFYESLAPLLHRRDQDATSRTIGVREMMSVALMTMTVVWLTDLRKFYVNAWRGPSAFEFKQSGQAFGERRKNERAGKEEVGGCRDARAKKNSCVNSTQ